jgi:hypothetical protein
MAEVIVERGTQDPSKVKKHVSMVLVPTLVAGMKDLNGFQEDLKTILNTEQISVSTLARSVAVDRTTVSRWLWGHHLPQEPLTLISLKLWAKRIRGEGG